MSKRAEDTVVIRNIYYMMAYAFRALSLVEYRKLALESFEHLDDLLAAILVTEKIDAQIDVKLTEIYLQKSLGTLK